MGVFSFSKNSDKVENSIQMNKENSDIILTDDEKYAINMILDEKSDDELYEKPIEVILHNDINAAKRDEAYSPIAKWRERYQDSYEKEQHKKSSELQNEPNKSIEKDIYFLHKDRIIPDSNLAKNSNKTNQAAKNKYFKSRVNKLNTKDVNFDGDKSKSRVENIDNNIEINKLQHQEQLIKQIAKQLIEQAMPLIKKITLDNAESDNKTLQKHDIQEVKSPAQDMQDILQSKAQDEDTINDSAEEQNSKEILQSKAQDEDTINDSAEEQNSNDMLQNKVQDENDKILDSNDDENQQPINKENILKDINDIKSEEEDMANSVFSFFKKQANVEEDKNKQTASTTPEMQNPENGVPPENSNANMQGAGGAASPMNANMQGAGGAASPMSANTQGGVGAQNAMGGMPNMQGAGGAASPMNANMQGGVGAQNAMGGMPNMQGAGGAASPMNANMQGGVGAQNAMGGMPNMQGADGAASPMNANMQGGVGAQNAMGGMPNMQGAGGAASPMNANMQGGVVQNAMGGMPNMQGAGGAASPMNANMQGGVVQNAMGGMPNMQGAGGAASPMNANMQGGVGAQNAMGGMPNMQGSPEMPPQAENVANEIVNNSSQDGQILSGNNDATDNVANQTIIENPEVNSVQDDMFDDSSDKDDVKNDDMKAASNLGERIGRGRIIETINNQQSQDGIKINNLVDDNNVAPPMQNASMNSSKPPQFTDGRFNSFAKPNSQEGGIMDNKAPRFMSPMVHTEDQNVNVATNAILQQINMSTSAIVDRLNGGGEPNADLNRVTPALYYKNMKYSVTSLVIALIAGVLAIFSCISIIGGMIAKNLSVALSVVDYLFIIIISVVSIMISFKQKKLFFAKSKIKDYLKVKCQANDMAKLGMIISFSVICFSLIMLVTSIIVGAVVL